MQAEFTALQRAFHDAIEAEFGPEHADIDLELREATKPEFGHLQSNIGLRLAKPLGLPPRQIAERVVARIDVSEFCEPLSVAGAGFINITWLPAVLIRWVNAMVADPHTGIVQAAQPQRVVIDYSAPNVAKQMHVGHLRSSVIGDALTRTLRAAGHTVIPQNHLGDWGTQFGMLIEQLDAEGHDAAGMDLDGLDQLYRRARAHFDSDETFAERARNRVVALQGGDEATLTLWHQLVSVSLNAFQQMYERMGVLLTPADVAGESSYNAALGGVVADLKSAGLVEVSDGALCAFPAGFTGREGEPVPLMVQKADGGFGYAATDLAAVRNRIDNLKADRLVYVVDARQGMHFAQVFSVARTAGWLPESVPAEHVAFGTVLGPDNKPFKTRSGDTVTLGSLLDDAEQRALAVVSERGSHLQAGELESVARSIGIGAVKYADLSNDLGRNYVFAVDRMVAMEGNTGPYLQYAHARINSILNRADQSAGQIEDLTEPAELRLAYLITQFPSTVAKVVDTLQPHHLCSYLYALAVGFSGFYEHCPVLPSEGATRANRLALCNATRKVLAEGLNLLGIDAPERM